MAVQQPRRRKGSSSRRDRGDVDRLVRDALRGSGQHRRRQSSGVPWWGWLIAGFLVLKACGMAAEYTGDGTVPPSTVPTTIQGGP